MKIHIIIKTCIRYKARLDIIKETWLPTVPKRIEYTIALGGKVPEGGNNDLHVYYTGAPDDYHFLPAKNLSAMHHALETNWDWLFTCDDDTYVCPIRLEKFLSEQPSEIYAIGGQHHINKDGSIHNIQGGSGYALRREVVEKLVSRFKEEGSLASVKGADDLLISASVQLLGYKWTVSPFLRLYGDITEYFVAQHCLPYQKMRELHAYYLAHQDTP